MLSWYKFEGSIANVIEFDFSDQVPHVACDQKSVCRLSVSNSIEHIIFIISHIPHIVFVKHNLFLSPLQSCQVPLFHYFARAYFYLKQIVRRVRICENPFVIDDLDFVEVGKWLAILQVVHLDLFFQFLSLWIDDRDVVGAISHVQFAQTVTSKAPSLNQRAWQLDLFRLYIWRGEAR